MISELEKLKTRFNSISDKKRDEISTLSPCAGKVLTMVPKLLAVAEAARRLYPFNDYPTVEFDLLTDLNFAISEIDAGPP